jgi:hypothetical protein
MRASDVDVIVIDEHVPAAPVAALRRTRTPLWPSRSIGLLATVLLHLLIAAPMVLGYSAHKSKPQTPDGIGSVAFASEGEQVESMILLDLSTLYASEEQDFEKPDIDAEGILLEELKLQLVSLDPKPPAELPIDEADLAETSNVAAGDPAGNAALFGSYMGLVSARIERAWMRPRTAVEGGHFDCRARILQDRQRNVESIALQGCGTNETWRRSLTSAILRASPLSAPPEPWLFTNTITLSFSADQYVAGQTPEYQYEPAITRVAMNGSSGRATSPVEVVDQARQVLNGGGDVELTITGDEVRWAKKEASATTPQ